MVIDYAGARFVTDPTFDPPGVHGVMERIVAPAIPLEDLGSVDVVLLSHDEHSDNFDSSGRALAMTTKAIVTGMGAARRLGAPAVGLTAGESVYFSTDDQSVPVEITAVEAVHGPLDGAQDATGNVNAEVIGFVLRTPGQPTVYISGDNASMAPLAAITSRFPQIDVAILFTGAARLPSKNDGRPLTLTSQRAADAAVFIGAPHVVPAHYQGWSMYSENADDIVRAFDEAGIKQRLHMKPAGTWTL